MLFKIFETGSHSVVQAGVRLHLKKKPQKTKTNKQTTGKALLNQNTHNGIDFTYVASSETCREGSHTADPSILTGFEGGMVIWGLWQGRGP